jgi:putative transposase
MRVIHIPRNAREKSKSGIYHVMLRGTNRQEIFHDDQDYLRFLETLELVKGKTGLKVYGWCLMTNHVHLLIGEGKEEISLVMKRLGVSFVYYYNWKYYTIGHLFQDRFRSEKVEDDAYLMTVIRYIHQNPVKTGLVKRTLDWRWSSCHGYYGDRNFPPGLLNTELILGLFSNQTDSAVKRFREFDEETNQDQSRPIKTNQDQCLDETLKVRLNDAEAKLEIKKLLSGYDIVEIKSLTKAERDRILTKIEDIEGITQRQAARILGISPNLIFKT